MYVRKLIPCPHQADLALEPCPFQLLPSEMIRYCSDVASWERSPDYYHLLLVMLASDQPIHHVLSRDVAKFLEPPRELLRLQAIAQNPELCTARDGLAYSRKEFIEHYGLKQGQRQWNAATPIFPWHAHLHVVELLSGRSWKVKLPGKLMAISSSSLVRDPITTHATDAQQIVVAVVDDTFRLDGLDRVLVVDTVSGKVESSDSYEASALAISADCKSIAVGINGIDAGFKISDLPFKGWESVHRPFFVEFVSALAYTPSGEELVALINAPRHICVINVLSRSVMHSVDLELGDNKFAYGASAMTFSLTGERLAITGSAEHEHSYGFGFILLFAFPDMHLVCSLKPCETWHREVACTDSIVLAGGDGGISMLEHGCDGRRILFQDQVVDALAFTSTGQFFAFAGTQDVSLVEMCGYTIIYSLPVPQGLDVWSLKFVDTLMVASDFTHDAGSSTSSTSSTSCRLSAIASHDCCHGP